MLMKEGKIRKTGKEEWNVDILKVNENILESRKEIEKLYISYSSKTSSLETNIHGIGWEKKHLKRAAENIIIEERTEDIRTNSVQDQQRKHLWEEKQNYLAFGMTVRTSLRHSTRRWDITVLTLSN